VRPQLSVTNVPHLFPHAALALGVQQLPSAVHTWLGFVQVLRMPNSPQLTVWLQLLVACPHWRLPHACCSDSGMHCIEPHVPQLMGLPQLSVVDPQRPVHHFGSGWHVHT
jgi:hypothetical protein